MAVTVYSTPACPYCKMVKDYLTEQGVGFEEIDISADMGKATELIEKSGQMGVPVTDIGGEMIVGFDIVALSEALEKKGLVRKEAQGYG